MQSSGKPGEGLPILIRRYISNSWLHYILYIVHGVRQIPLLIFYVNHIVYPSIYEKITSDRTGKSITVAKRS